MRPHCFTRHCPHHCTKQSEFTDDTAEVGNPKKVDRQHHIGFESQRATPEDATGHGKWKKQSIYRRK